ncbi:class I SAM-dependent methyltransferase [Marinicaulis aureus]|uniref:Class I SAM-dependent methyltransferase n=1 Tax=Hyphococcus aureus TaxID=2666033 RepID=A0ABW1KTZ6_9PROT
MVAQPHYIREYNRLLRNLRKTSASETETFERAVGGGFKATGATQAKLILGLAPQAPFHLIDVGCGSGRLAYALRNEERVSYTGFDILPDLIGHAEKVCERPDWRFDAIYSLALPIEDDAGDMIVFMSVFTHLKPDEIKTYLSEAVRVLKPGGRIVASYFDADDPQHAKLFPPAPVQYLARILGRDVLRVRLKRKDLETWMRDAGVVVEQALTQGPLTQHVMIARKPSTAEQNGQAQL